jgi:3-oxoacyl-[acyl-carrier protein] reductase
VLFRSLDTSPVIDIMIANAGISGIIKNAWDYSLEEWNHLIRQDLTSVFLTCRAVVPQMVARGYGRIVVVASIAGLEGAPTNAAYAAAKAGAIGYTKALGKELAKTGVMVNCLAPSGIETELLGGVTPEYLDKVVLSKMPIGRLGQPEEAAALIAWLASEDCSFCAGAVFDLYCRQSWRGNSSCFQWPWSGVLLLKRQCDCRQSYAGRGFGQKCIDNRLRCPPGKRHGRYA